MCVCVNLQQVQDLDLCRLAVQASALSSPRALLCACCWQEGKRQLVGRKRVHLLLEFSFGILHQRAAYVTLRRCVSACDGCASLPSL